MAMPAPITIDAQDDARADDRDHIDETAQYPHMHAVGSIGHRPVEFNHGLSQATFVTHKEESIKLLLYFLSRSTSVQHQESHASLLLEDKKEIRWFRRQGINIYFLFYFLPCKDYATMGSRTCTWDFLTLKESGWGPPRRANQICGAQIKRVFIA